jgi:hypothetical protein
MKLKAVLLDCMIKDQLKAVCEELEAEADRRSQGRWSRHWQVQRR